MKFVAVLLAIITATASPLWLPLAAKLVAPYLPVFNPRLKLVLSLLDHPGWEKQDYYPPRISHPHGVSVQYQSYDFPCSTADLKINGTKIRLGWFARLRLAAAYRRWDKQIARDHEEKALSKLARSIIEREENVVQFKRAGEGK